MVVDVNGIDARSEMADTQSPRTPVVQSGPWDSVRGYLAHALLRVLLPTTTCAAVLGMTVSAIPPARPIEIAVGACFLCAAIGPWLLYRRQKYLPGITLFIGGLVLIAIAGVFAAGGVQQPPFVVLITLFSAAVWFLPRWGIALYVIMFFAVGVAASVLQDAGVTPAAPPRDGLWYATMVSILTGSIGLILHTVQRMLQGALEQTRRGAEILQSVFTAVDEGIILLDAELQPVSMNVENDRFEHALNAAGISMEMLLGANASVHEDDATTVFDRLREAVSTDTSCRMTVQVLDAGGEQKFFEISAAPVPARPPHFSSGLALLVRDATDETRERQHWAQGQKMEAIGKLASGVAHDFNNILGSIQASSELLDAHGDAEQEQLMATIRRASRRASVLTRSLSLHSAHDAERPSYAEAHALVQESVELLSRSLDPNVRIAVEAEDPTAGFKVSPAELQGVLINLGVNAAHAMDNRGNLTFRVRTATLPGSRRSPALAQLPDGDYTVIDVQDSGCGIPHALLDKIFTPFFTTKARGQGTGLGLSNAATSIQRFGGAIEVQTSQGAGSTFSLWLPRAFPEMHSAPRARPTPPRAPRHGEGLRVMLIDDDPLIRRVLSIGVERFGHKLCPFGTGAAALEALRAEPFDVVLLDMVMPDMTGPEVFSRIRQLASPPHVVVLTGYAENEAVRDVRAQGVFAVAPKPFQLGEVIDLLERAARTPRTGGTPSPDLEHNAAIG